MSYYDDIRLAARRLRDGCIKADDIALILAELEPNVPGGLGLDDDDEDEHGCACDDSCTACADGLHTACRVACDPTYAALLADTTWDGPLADHAAESATPHP